MNESRPLARLLQQLFTIFLRQHERIRRFTFRYADIVVPARRHIDATEHRCNTHVVPNATHGPTTMNEGRAERAYEQIYTLPDHLTRKACPAPAPLATILAHPFAARDTPVQQI